MKKILLLLLSLLLTGCFNNPIQKKYEGIIKEKFVTRPSVTIYYNVIVFDSTLNRHVIADISIDEYAKYQVGDNISCYVNE